MEKKRFEVIENYDGHESAAIRDNHQPEDDDIVVILPVFAWSLDPVVKLLNELYEAAKC